jgi:hypothetical protein
VIARASRGWREVFHHIVQDVVDGQRGWFWRFYRLAQVLGDPIHSSRQWTVRRSNRKADVRRMWWEEIGGAGGIFGLKVLVWVWISSGYAVRRDLGGGRVA